MEKAKTGREMEFDETSKRVIGCAIEVHRLLGPGLLESAYLQCLAHELSRQGVAFELEKPLPVKYKDIQLDCGYRIDLLVNKSVIVELKSADHLMRIHEAQILAYMKLANTPIGLLINFNVTRLKDGIRRFVL